MMRNILAKVALVFLGTCLARAEQVTVIHVGILIDGTSDTPRRNQVIITRGQRIESVGDEAGALLDRVNDAPCHPVCASANDFSECV